MFGWDGDQNTKMREGTPCPKRFVGAIEGASLWSVVSWSKKSTAALEMSVIEPKGSETCGTWEHLWWSLVALKGTSLWSAGVYPIVMEIPVFQVFALLWLWGQCFRYLPNHRQGGSQRVFPHHLRGCWWQQGWPQAAVRQHMVLLQVRTVIFSAVFFFFSIVYALQQPLCTWSVLFCFFQAISKFLWSSLAKDIHAYHYSCTVFVPENHENQ